MSYTHLTYESRCQIYALKSKGLLQKEIALQLNVDAGTISRELKRNRGARGYRFKQAQEKSESRRWEASSKPKRMTESMVKVIDSKLEEKWSPEQISGVLKASGTPISHESIYRHVWSDKFSGGKLYKHLRRKGKKYNYKGGSKAGRGCIPNRVDIKDRPLIVEKKQRFGDWEADTIIGAQHKGAIVSLVDRKSKFTFLYGLPNKSAALVTEATIVCLKKLPNKMKQTITYDNGKEFSNHEKIAEALGVKCYFATPYHSWERGLNEHTNGLVRQHFPKGTDLSIIPSEEIQFVEDQLNDRPRKVLGYRTPREVTMGLKKPSPIALQC
jgi:IS30 family transposase